MARPTNRQSRSSVGNLGDILKHAALFELASMLARRSSAVSYVDTHTFLLHAALADAERWRREADGLVSAHPAYAGYAAHERASLLRTAHYRCSSGLVIDVLDDRRAFAALGEANGATRAELREQIRVEQLANVLVASDAAAALRDAAPGLVGSVLVHVDPFSLSPELWASIAPALDAACARSPEAVLVVYRYTRSARSAWPSAPRAMLGPVAQIRGGPHEMAVYASPTIADLAREVCGSLGWIPEPA